MRQTATFTVSVPPTMAKQVERAMKAEQRTRSELVREALRMYLSARAIPLATVSRKEAQAHRRGLAAYKRGDYITLGEYIDGMERRPRRARKKVS